MEQSKIIVLVTVSRQLECVKNLFFLRSNKLERFCMCLYFALGEQLQQLIRSALLTNSLAELEGMWISEANRPI